MNIDEWREMKIADVEKAYEIIKQFNPTVVPQKDRFWDVLDIRFTEKTFPYDKSTSITVQVVGTGSRGRFDVRFYFWVDPIHAYIDFKITTDQQLNYAITFLENVNITIKAELVEKLSNELSKEITNQSWVDESEVEKAYRLNEPRIKAKIQRINTLIEALQ